MADFLFVLAFGFVVIALAHVTRGAIEANAKRRKGSLSDLLGVANRFGTNNGYSMRIELLDSKCQPCHRYDVYLDGPVKFSVWDYEKEKWITREVRMR